MKNNNKVRYLQLIAPKEEIVLNENVVSEMNETWEEAMDKYGLNKGEKRDFWQEIADERGEQALALTDLDITLGDYMTAYICAFTDLSRKGVYHSLEEIKDTYDSWIMGLEITRKEELLFCNN